MKPLKSSKLLVLLMILSPLLCKSQDALLFCAKKKIGDTEYTDNSSLFTIRKDYVLITETNDTINQRFAILRKEIKASEGLIKYYFGKYDCISWYKETGLIIVQKNFKLTTYSKCSE